MKELMSIRSKRCLSILVSIALAGMISGCDNVKPPTVPTNGSPTASLTVSETQPLMGATAVSFTATGSDPDGDALSYSWNFGDGATANGTTVTHAFALAGTHNVVVTVTDGRGGSATSNVSVTARSLAGAWTSQARAWNFEIQHVGDRITGRLLGFKGVTISPAPSLSGFVASPRSVQFDVPGGLSFVGTSNAGASQMTGTLSEGSRNYGEILDRQ